jgi:hypothetical protein
MIDNPIYRLYNSKVKIAFLSNIISIKMLIEPAVARFNLL